MDGTSLASDPPESERRDTIEPAPIIGPDSMLLSGPPPAMPAVHSKDHSARLPQKDASKPVPFPRSPLGSKTGTVQDPSAHHSVPLAPRVPKDLPAPPKLSAHDLGFASRPVPGLPRALPPPSDEAGEEKTVELPPRQGQLHRPGLAAGASTTQAKPNEHPKETSGSMNRGAIFPKALDELSSPSKPVAQGRGGRPMKSDLAAVFGPPRPDVPIPVDIQERPSTDGRPSVEEVEPEPVSLPPPPIVVAHKPPPAPHVAKPSVPLPMASLQDRISDVGGGDVPSVAYLSPGGVVVPDLGRSVRPSKRVESISVPPFAQAPRRAPWIVAGIGGVLAVLLGITIWNAGSPKETSTPQEQTSSNTPLESAQAPSASAPIEPSAVAPEPSSQAALPSTSAAPPSASAETPSSKAANDSPKAPASPPAADTRAPDPSERSTSGAPTARTSPASVPASGKREKTEPKSSGGAFDKAAASSAIAAAKGSILACKRPEGPTGNARVSITFAPTGRVTTATIDGPPFAGTPVGGCIASRFRGVSVPPFSGGPITVHATVPVF